HRYLRLGDLPSVEVGQPGVEVAGGGVTGLPARILAEQVADQIRRRPHLPALLVAQRLLRHGYVGERGMTFQHDERVDDAAVDRPACHGITSSTSLSYNCMHKSTSAGLRPSSHTAGFGQPGMMNSALSRRRRGVA